MLCSGRKALPPKNQRTKRVRIPQMKGFGVQGEQLLKAHRNSAWIGLILLHQSPQLVPLRIPCLGTARPSPASSGLCQDAPELSHPVTPGWKDKLCSQDCPPARSRVADRRGRKKPKEGLSTMGFAFNLMPKKFLPASAGSKPGADLSQDRQSQKNPSDLCSPRLPCRQSP